MEVAEKILNETVRCQEIIFLLDGVVGFLAVLAVALFVWRGRMDKIFIYLAVFSTIGILCISFFGVLLPMHKDINDNQISVVEGTYDGRNQKGAQSGILSTGTVFFTPDSGESTSFDMPTLFDSTFQQYFFDNFPAKGPLAVRLYYAENSNLALYMETIE